jgi:hypothetical protein
MVSITKPNWLWSPISKVMKPMSRFAILLPLAALCFVGALLVLAGERQDSRAMIEAGGVLSLPFGLWATVFLSMFVVIFGVISVKALRGLACKHLHPKASKTECLRV